MDNSRTILSRHEISVKNLMRSRPTIFKQRLKSLAHQFRTLNRLNNRIFQRLVLFVRHNFLDSVACNVKLFIAVRHQRIIDILIHRQDHICWQSPRRCRPRKQIFILILQLKVDEQARISIHLIAIFHSHFTLRNWRCILRAIDQNLFAFVDFTFFVKSLERPPNRFHVIIIHGFISALKLDPTTNSLNRVFPLGASSHHSRSTFLDIIRNANFCANLFFIRNA